MCLCAVVVAVVGSTRFDVHLPTTRLRSPSDHVTGGTHTRTGHGTKQTHTDVHEKHRGLRSQKGIGWCAVKGDHVGVMRSNV